MNELRVTLGVFALCGLVAAAPAPARVRWVEDFAYRGPQPVARMDPAPAIIIIGPIIVRQWEWACLRLVVGSTTPVIVGGGVIVVSDPGGTDRIVDQEDEVQSVSETSLQFEVGGAFPAPGAYGLRLETPDGTSNVWQLTVVEADAITIDARLPGGAWPGSAVTLRGGPFGQQPGTLVVGPAGAEVPTATSWSDEEITFDVPDSWEATATNGPGEYTVSVRDASGRLSANTSSVVALPTTPSIADVSWVNATGGPVVVTGDWFERATQALAGQVWLRADGAGEAIAASASSWSIDEVTFQLPAGLAASFVDVSIERSDGAVSGSRRLWIGAGP
jgi:hypothetical protein